MTQFQDSIEEKYHPIPHPDELPDREREDAMGAYLMMFAAVAVALPLPVINLIAAIIYYIVNRKKSRFIHFHSLQSLITQLPTTLLNWGVLIWGVQIWLFKSMEAGREFFSFLAFAGIANVIYFTFSLVAAVKARRGQMYYFIVFGWLSREIVFNKSRQFTYENQV